MVQVSVNLSGIDLNLLVILDALLEERNVTRVGERVGRSQPAVSNALRRLRGILNDELLVQDGRTMRLTERAHEIKVPLRQALGAVKRTLEHRVKFDPSEDEFTIRLFTSDYISVVMLPKLLERMKKEAPQANLIVSWGNRQRVMSRLLEESIDFAIGHHADAPNDIRRHVLFNETPVVVGRKGHPSFRGGLTLDKFVDSQHMAVSFEGLPFGWIDQALARAEKSIRSEVVMTHFAVTPFILLKTDLLLMIGERLAKSFEDVLPLETHPTPFDIESLRVELLWNSAMEQDPALCWFRDLVIEVAAEL